MTFRETEQTSCRVEISGWDAAENFFVEKTVLRRCDDGSQKALLHTLLRVGALGFARLTDEPTPDRAVPITYQVATINGKFSAAGEETQLRQRHPRQSPWKELPDFLFESVMKN